MFLANRNENCQQIQEFCNRFVIAVMQDRNFAQRPLGVRVRSEHVLYALDGNTTKETNEKGQVEAERRDTSHWSPYRWPDTLFRRIHFPAPS